MFGTKKTICPICGSRALKKHWEIDSYEKKFTTDKCQKCDFIFMNPAFTDETIKSLYQEDYYSGKNDYSYIDERKNEKASAYLWDRRIKVIKSYVGGGGNFLDVGCSFGGLLTRAEKIFTSHGIEISPYAFKHAAKKFPGRVHRGTLKDHPFCKNFFSAITMIELIEHLEYPADAIRECHNLLKPGGVLVIQTANMAGRQAVKRGKNYEYFMPGHLSYFTAKNLTNLLKSNNFKKIKIYYPVEFGLIPKLLKSRGNFTKLSDYNAWLRISSYHIKSKIHLKNFAMTSSMVIYAFK